MPFNAIILAASDPSHTVNLPLLIALAAAVLAAIALVRISSLVKHLNRSAPTADQQPPAVNDGAPCLPTISDSGQISPQILAVIAAAVAACAGKSVRIVSIKPTSTSWERAGRQSVLTSHRIR